MQRRLAFGSLLATFVILSSAAYANTAWYVDGVNGNDSNNCMSSETACKTIGHAISLASSGDSISIAAATYKENLTVGFSLTIAGSGAIKTIINGGGKGTVVTVSNASAQVTLSGVTVRNGNAVFGGGINNEGTLTINSSTVTGNHAVNGGGIGNSGRLTINKSTVSGNTIRANHASGGGIDNIGSLAINNSTISANTANPVGVLSFAVGGGISNTSGTVTINNGTVSQNFSGTHNSGGIYGPATLQNSIIANNMNGNCYGPLTSNGYNLSSDGTCNLTGPGDMNNVDPMLGPLQNNGGQTQTQALSSGSPAIDTGNPSGCTDNLSHLLKTDQRGQPRADKEDTGGCDIGAYESQSD